MSQQKVFKDEFPVPEKKLDGGWYGSEESRIAYYLKMHGKLWGFCNPNSANAKRTCFLSRKKTDGYVRF